MAARGEAGDRGPKVRSDCWIAVEMRDQGGVEIALRSKVAGLYGESIESLIADGCAALGVEHAAVEVEDQGALPFVLAARLETAVKRALPNCAAEFMQDPAS